MKDKTKDLIQGINIFIFVISLIGMVAFGLMGYDTIRDISGVIMVISFVLFFPMSYL